MRFGDVWIIGVFGLVLPMLPCRGATSPESVGDSSCISAQGRTPQQFVQSAQKLVEQSQYQDALTCYRYALEGFRAAHDPQGQADVMSDLGVVYRNLGDAVQSVTLQQQAITLYQAAGNLRGEAKALRRIGVLYRHQGDFARSISAQEQALTLLQRLDDHKGTAMILTNLGTTYGDVGRLQEARAYFEQALQIYTQQQDQAGISYIYGNLGQLFLYLGDSQHALQYLEQSLAIKQSLDDIRGQANTLLNIGTTYKNQGDFQKALTFYYQAQEFYQQLRDRYGEAATLGSIGTTYEELGDLDRALQFQLQSFELKKSGGMTPQLAIALTNLASLAIKQRRFPDADAYLQEGLAIATTQGSLLAQAHISGQMGLLHLQQEQLDYALTEFQRALTLYEQIGSHKGRLESFDFIGQTYLRQGMFAQAQSYYEQALGLAQTLNDPQALWKIQYHLGELAQQRGDVEQSLIYFAASVETLERMRSYLHMPELRELFVQTKINPYAQMIRLLLQQQKSAEALWYLERFKARTLLDIVSYGTTSLQAVPELLREEQYTSARIAYLQSKLSDWNGQGEPLSSEASSPGEDRAKIADYISQEVHQAKEHYEQLLVQIKLKYPDYYRLKTVDASEIQQRIEHALQLIEPDMLLLEYFLDENALQIWAIEQQHLHHLTVPIGYDAILSKILTLRTNLRQYYSDRVYADLSDLYTWLIAPVKPYLPGKTTIGVIPFQALHFVPFSALLSEPWSASQAQTAAIPPYLIEQYALFALPSLSILPVVRERTLHHAQDAQHTPQRYILGIGNASENLPGAEQEILTITRNVSNSDSYTGKSATKQRLFEAADQYQVVHLATHAVYDKHHPMFSYLELLPENLSANEVLGLHVRANLVTLSGCETLLPQQIDAADAYTLVSGDELVGFIRAFMHAGVPSVLSSLWRINDVATQTLMSTFYQQLPQVGKVQALQRAYQAVIGSTLQVGRREPREIQLSHPFFWSSFVLLGDWQ